MSEHEFVVTVLDRILQHPGETKYRSVRLKADIVMRAWPLLESVGFEQHGETLVLPASKVDSVPEAIRTIQAQADSLLDPDSITFAQVADILKRDGKLPGIRDDINDLVLDDHVSFTETQRPPKPWETNS